MNKYRLFAGALAAALCTAGAADAQVVVSQVYGGGGNSGATLKQDFMELLNRGTTPQSLSGWSVQYSSSAVWQVTSLPAVTLMPGQYFLIGQAFGAAGSVDLPTVDATGVVPMSANRGKVALVNTTTALAGICPTGATLVDWVGYGTAATVDCWNGTAPTGALTNTTAAARLNGGCQDTNDDDADFNVSAPAPRNTASAFSNCSGTPPMGMGSADPFVVCNGDSVTINVTATPGTDPASTGITVIGNLSFIGGSASQLFADLGGNSFSYTQVVGAGTTAGLRTLPITVADAQNRSSLFSIEVVVDRCSPSSTGLIEPLALCTSGGTARVVVFVNPASTLNPVFAPGSISTDLSMLGGSAAQTLFDDATNGDRVTADNIWSIEFPVGAFPVGVRTVTWSGADLSGRPISGTAAVQFIECSSTDTDVVISQVYGGGGNTGAPFTNDFIEIFNRGQLPVDLTGWSVQYAATAGAFSNKTDLLAVLLQPGQYLLIQEAAGNACGMMPCGAPLPSPDVTGTIAMSGTSAKVALVSSTVPIGSNCTDASVVDLVAYGTGVTCQEGLFGAPGLGNSVSNFRLDGGCQDTDQNAPDFFPAAPAPRNSATAVNLCDAAPATGACCLIDRTCSVQTAADCASAGGFYLGNNEACVQATCDSQSVACCINGTCSVVSLEACNFQENSTVDSFGASCSGVTCPAVFCDADWCQDGVVGVPDIFCFLSDWFANDPIARNYGGTNGVPAIFAFLSIWFATGIGPCP